MSGTRLCETQIRVFRLIQEDEHMDGRGLCDGTLRSACIGSSIPGVQFAGYEDRPLVYRESA